MKFNSFIVFISIVFWGMNLYANKLDSVSGAGTNPDPNFHIYICFGQSNMEGASPIVDTDRLNVNERFKVMTVSAGDFSHNARKVGEWYTATPPLCRWDNGLTPADYFGRTLVDSLPDSIKVGVIVVAMGGSGIDAFDKVNYTQYYQNADAWQRSLMNIYGGKPYAKIIEMAKLAQQSGVIKGILLHQGETNNGQTDWPLKVKKIYYDILSDLNIEANSIPLLSGEMLYQNQGGICWGMNSVIATLPNFIPNSHVISSDGCSGIDDFHFSNAGQHELGKRYGLKMLSLLKEYNTVEGQTVDTLSVESNLFTMLTGTSKKLPLTAIYVDGHPRDISYLANYSISNPEVVEIENGILKTLKDGESQVTASFQGEIGDRKEITFTVKASTFPLTNALFNPKIWENGTFNENTKTLKTGQWGFGGWQYQAIDLSAYKYIVVKLGSANNADIAFNIYDGASYWGSPASYKFGSGRQVVVNLKQVKKNDGTLLDPSHIYIAGFWSNGSSPFVIDTVFLSNSSEYDPPLVEVEDGLGHELKQIDGFQYVEGNGPSVCKPVWVNGSMLNASISIKASSGFELALDSTQTFATTITLEPVNRQIAETCVYVRMKAGLSRKTYSGNLSFTSTGATSKSIVLSGSVLQPTAIHEFDSDAVVVSTTYYTVNGVPLKSIKQLRGIFIVKEKLADGKNRVSKIIQ